MQLTAGLAAKGLQLFAQLIHPRIKLSAESVYPCIEPSAECVYSGEYLSQCRFLVGHRSNRNAGATAESNRGQTAAGPKFTSGRLPCLPVQFLQQTAQAARCADPAGRNADLIAATPSHPLGLSRDR